MSETTTFTILDSTLWLKPGSLGIVFQTADQSSTSLFDRHEVRLSEAQWAALGRPVTINAVISKVE